MTGTKPKRPGPAPERLKLDEKDWKEAVRKAVKKTPPEGSPSGGKKKRATRKRQPGSGR